MNPPLDIDALDASDQAAGFVLTGLECSLIAEVRRLREIVLVTHYKREQPITGVEWCLGCYEDWPCPSARAAGAT